MNKSASTEGNYSVPFYESFLKLEFAKRRQSNFRYSLRAYARDLRMDAGALSAILNGRRPLSLALAERALKALKPPAELHRRVLASVAYKQNGRDLQRRDPRLKTIQSYDYISARVLDADYFETISDWYYAAILEMTYLADFVPDPKWIAEKLGIKVSQAKRAWQHLQKFDLVHEHAGRFYKSNDHLELSDPDGTSQARRKKQKQIRQKAIESIEKDSIETRYMTSITLCLDPNLLPEARRRIDEFNDSLCAFLESGARRQVYTLELGVFPLQKLKSKRGK